MDRDCDRLQHMDTALRHAGLSYERFAGVDGRQLLPRHERYIASPFRTHLSSSEAGCLISHLSVWQEIAEQKEPLGLVLEDDVHFQSDFGDFIRYLNFDVEPGLGEIHRFETFFARVTMERSPAYAFGSRSGHVLLSNHAGAAAYMLSRETARLLASKADLFRHLPDTEMFDPDRRAVPGLKIIQWTPAPCVQDMNLASAPTLFASNLEADRSDHRRGITPTPSAMTKRLKSALRPAYTKLYSLSVAPRGRMRKQIGFG